jgi:alkyl hydroperoxide reductase subunit AhpC
MSLSAWRGKFVLVNFWATWCVPCRAEMPEIEAAYQAHRAEGLTVLAVNQGEDKETVARFAQEFHLTFPILLDSDGQVAKRYAVRGLPASYFVDREAVIRAIRFGEMSGAMIASQLVSLGLPAISGWHFNPNHHAAWPRTAKYGQFFHQARDAI